MKCVVAVFAKLPVPGRVKTRLAQAIGPEAAAQAYQGMLDHVLGRTARELPTADFKVLVFCDPFAPLDAYRRHFDRYGFECRLQVGNDLGERLLTALTESLTLSRNAIAIGTDCITLTAQHLIDSTARLDEGSDLVLGPAEDGGYYLIGLKRAHSALFSGVPWSSGDVLRTTKAIAEDLGCKISLLPILNDIDTLEDLRSSELTTH